jgi:hypothetical protein
MTMLRTQRRLAVALTVLCGAAGSAGIARGQTEPQGGRMATDAGASAPRPKTTPEGVLESRGLGKAGKYYVVATEKEVGASFNRIKPIYNVMEEALTQYMGILQAEATFQYLDSERILADTYIRDLGIQLANTPNNATNRQLIQQLTNEQRIYGIYLNEVNGNLQIARKNLVGPARKQAVWDEFMKRRADFLEANKQLSPIVAKAVKEYAALKKDAAVKDALQVIAKRKNSPVSLGPSKDLTTAITKLRKAEEMVSFNPDAYRRSSKRKSRIPKNVEIGG